MTPAEFYHPDREAKRARRAETIAKKRALIVRCKNIANLIQYGPGVAPSAGSAISELCEFAEQALEDLDY